MVIVFQEYFYILVSDSGLKWVYFSKIPKYIEKIRK